VPALGGAHRCGCHDDQTADRGESRCLPEQIADAVAFFDEYDLIAVSLRDLLLDLMRDAQDSGSDGARS
jgi:hypothetical protein